MPVDQQIVKNNIDRVRGHVRAHGNLCVACASLGGIDAHLDAVKDHAAHNDPEIGCRAVMRFRCGAAYMYDGICQSYEQNT